MKDRLIAFAEENWTAFLQRCEESGMSEEETEERFEEYRMELFISKGQERKDERD